MKSWQPNSTETIKWGNHKQPDEIDYWPLSHPCTPGRCTLTTLPENWPPKILKPAKISLFDLLLLGILAIIDNWLISLEYQNNSKHVL